MLNVVKCNKNIPAFLNNATDNTATNSNHVLWVVSTIPYRCPPNNNPFNRVYNTICVNFIKPLVSHDWLSRVIFLFHNSAFICLHLCEREETENAETAFGMVASRAYPLYSQRY